MTQNIYDDPKFFEGYTRLPRSVEGLEAAGEWPALRAMLPDLNGLPVLDLGCGFGWFCRWARGQGAVRVLGVDVSENMLARARATTADPGISYLHADLETFAIPGGPYGLIYSSLALHYIADLGGLLGRVHGALAPGGHFVFSVEHPIMMAPAQPGWTAAADGRPIWPLDAYLIEGPRRTDWLTEGVVKQHRTMATTLNLLIRHGFALSHVEEWGPTDAQIAAHPDWAKERQRPPFLLVAATR